MTVRSGTDLPAAGSRQRLTLLFTDLTGSTHLARGIEPEEYADVLERIRAVWHGVAERYQGQVVRSQGDGALIQFGFPLAAEDDGRRAVEAALDIHQLVDELVFADFPDRFAPLKMHSGVHAGTLLVSPGDLERGRFDLTGDVANTAAHLCHVAHAGQIIASAEALGPHANCFELIAGPAQPPPGSDPLTLFCVVGRSGLHRRFDATARRGLTPLAGRDGFVARIEGFLSGAQGQQNIPLRCLVLVGNAGMGKTRLLEEIVRRRTLPDQILLRGGCESFLGAEALQPFSQMLRNYFGVAGRVSGADLGPETLAAMRPWQQRLGAAWPSLLGLIISDTDRQDRRVTTGGIVGDLIAFFSALSAQQPVVLLVDDWQWADDASRQVLATLVDHPSGPRFVLASRPSASGSHEILGAQHLHLTPLAESDTIDAIRRWIPNADPFLCRQIHDYSGGTPLFIEELCHSASAGALARAIERRGAAQNWLGSLVATRLARLAQPLADLVRVAAVIGNEVQIALVEAVIGHVPAPDALEALAQADFLYPTDSAGVLRFKHGITCDAIYQSIGLSERVALHERVLSALLARADDATHDDTIEALAHHSRGAGRWDQASRFAERAGDKATQAFALDRARQHYEWAMAALDRMAHPTQEHTLRWCMLSNKLGMTCIFDPLALADDSSLFERAVSVAATLGDANALARATYWLAYICYGLGRFRESLRQTQAALLMARQAKDQRLAVQVEATLGQVLAATCDYGQAIELIDVAVDAKRQRSRPRGGLAIGSAYALACKGGILADQGAFAAAHACFDEAIDLLEGSTHPVGNSVRNWIAVAYNWQGQWGQARRVATDSLRIAENTHALLLLAAARSSAGYAAWAADGSATGLAHLQEAMHWMEERRGHFYTSIYCGWLVAASVTEGRLELARAHARTVLRRARRGERLGEAVVCRSQAWIAAQADDAATVARWMRRADTAAERRNSDRERALNHLMWGQILVRQGAVGPAGRRHAAAIDAFDRMAMTWHAGLARQQIEAMDIGKPVFT